MDASAANDTPWPCPAGVVDDALAPFRGYLTVSSTYTTAPRRRPKGPGTSMSQFDPCDGSVPRACASTCSSDAPAVSSSTPDVVEGSAVAVRSRPGVKRSSSRGCLRVGRAALLSGGCKVRTPEIMSPRTPRDLHNENIRPRQIISPRSPRSVSPLDSSRRFDQVPPFPETSLAPFPEPLRSIDSVLKEFGGIGAAIAPIDPASDVLAREGLRVLDDAEEVPVLPPMSLPQDITKFADRQHWSEDPSFESLLGLRAMVVLQD